MLTDTTAFEFHCSMRSVISLRHLQRIDNMAKETKMRVVADGDSGERLFASGQSEITDLN